MSGPYFGLESFPHLTFRDLQDRLISLVVTKIRNGEFTERRLARVLGVSQPQLHNVLKGVRPLKPEFADCLLRQFDIGILDLVLCAELSAQLEAHEAQCVKLWLESAQRTETAPPGRKVSGKEISDTQCVRRLAS
jgi:plasmid maintenance system antidote protein VapI